MTGTATCAVWVIKYGALRVNAAESAAPWRWCARRNACRTDASATGCTTAEHGSRPSARTYENVQPISGDTRIAVSWVQSSRNRMSETTLALADFLALFGPESLSMSSSTCEKGRAWVHSCCFSDSIAGVARAKSCRAADVHWRVVGVPRSRRPATLQREPRPRAAYPSALASTLGPPGLLAALWVMRTLGRGAATPSLP